MDLKIENLGNIGLFLVILGQGGRVVAEELKKKRKLILYILVRNLAVLVSKTFVETLVS